MTTVVWKTPGVPARTNACDYIFWQGPLATSGGVYPCCLDIGHCGEHLHSDEKRYNRVFGNRSPWISTKDYLELPEVIAYGERIRKLRIEMGIVG